MKKEITLFLYSEYPSQSLDLNLLADSLREYGFSVETRGNLIDFLSLSEEDRYNLAREISTTKIQDISVPLNTLNALDHQEINQELDKLLGRQSIRGNFYDGYWLQRILFPLFIEKAGAELNNRFIHIIFTGRLFGTFQDRRYHARVVLMGTPSLISTSGLVEAPAKPREYYYVKGRLAQSGYGTDELDKMYEGRYVEYDDPKITSILTSYALQVVFYELTGQAFCEEAKCCLSNSHWQEEVLKVQFDGKLCNNCEQKLR